MNEKQKARSEPKRSRKRASGSTDGQKPARSNRDEKGRFVKGEGRNETTFRTADERPREAGKASGAARREKSDLRRLCQLWMEEEVGTDNNGQKITGGQMMVRVAVKEVAKGNPRFWELLRDTAGYKPVDRVMVADVEPSVIAQVESMVAEMD